MPFDRRDFLCLAAAAGAAAALPPAAAGSAARARIRAVAFDGFPVFDPRPSARLAESMFPGRAAALVTAWRTRLFEYQWLRTLSGRYADFVDTAHAGLAFAAKAQGIELDEERRGALVHALVDLRPWPDAPAALAALREQGVRLGFLSNMTEGMLRNGIRQGGLEGLFEHVLSADRVRAHKPDPRAYAMGVEAFGVGREEILFASFAGWDTAGASWFGYPTFWVNRAGSNPEELAVFADASGPGLRELVDYVRERNAAARTLHPTRAATTT
ncbi:MAG TPA: haloacid dehalogenase type II [Usitatibacter sp.]|nr:haloacid dehalogenase type II [Usitatibacter sp.]